MAEPDVIKRSHRENDHDFESPICMKMSFSFFVPLW